MTPLQHDSGDVRLVEGPVIPDSTEDVCASLPSVEGERLLHVDLLRSPERRLRQWSREDRVPPDELVIVHGGYGAGVGRSVEDLGTSLGLSTSFVPVAQPGNLSRLGLEVTKFLDDSGAESVPAAVCLDSVSTLLQYTAPEAVVRFLRECRRLLVAHDAVGRFYVAPSVVDDEVLERFREAANAGEWTDANDESPVWRMGEV